MKLLISTTVSVALAASVAFAVAGDHPSLTNCVSTYRPTAGFNKVIGNSRFVGYFLTGPDRCDVTVSVTRADDEALSTPPRRMLLQIAAGGRSELDAGPNSALAIACTVDADAIKLAPQNGRWVKAAKAD